MSALFWRGALALLMLTGLWAPAPAAAHDARPVLVTVHQLGDARYSVTVRAPESVTADNLPQVVLPPTCTRLQGDDDGSDPTLPRGRMLIACTGKLDGARISLDYPLYNPSLSTLFRFEPKGQPTRSELLPPERAEWVVPVRPGTWEVLFDYLRLGVEHIFAGFDHLLFILGLLVLARSTRRILLAVTGFTVAHSLTLALSVLDLVRLPAAPVEAAIALSILFLANEIARPNPQSTARRYPVLVAAGFGLLHGFGFAGVLRELGLPPGEVGTALLGFNLGVELGQVIFILSALALYHAVTRAAPTRIQHGGFNLAFSYLLGTAASFWLLSRIASLGWW